MKGTNLQKNLICYVFHSFRFWWHSRHNPKRLCSHLPVHCSNILHRHKYYYDGRRFSCAAIFLLSSDVAVYIVLFCTPGYLQTWSITYHSWITFVLLLWASAMWLVPNQRKAMLRSSPFLVVYATLLLIAQYVYGMDLTEAELPEHVQGHNLAQIGFSKPKSFPVKPLLFKVSI